MFPLIVLIIAACCCNPQTSSDKEPTQEGGALARPALPPAQALSSEDRARLLVVSPTTVERIDEREPLDLTDITVMSQLGIPNAVIITQIERTSSHFNITEQDVGELSESGVSQEVIDYLQQT